MSTVAYMAGTRRTRADKHLLQTDPRVLRAYGHPTRQKIIAELDKQTPLSPAQISKLTGESLGNVSYHARILDDLGVVELVDTRPVRGALEHLYQLVKLGSSRAGEI